MKLNSRDRGLLWFKAETGEHRVVPAKVAAQLLLTEISNKILTEGTRDVKPENVAFCHSERRVGDMGQLVWIAHLSGVANIKHCQRHNGPKGWVFHQSQSYNCF